jgi:hypothetical protein
VAPSGEPVPPALRQTGIDLVGDMPWGTHVTVTLPGAPVVVAFVVRLPLPTRPP